MTTKKQPAALIEECDVVIVGAGPAGLSMVRALAPSGMTITVVEKNDQATLADPPFDGREIADSLFQRTDAEIANLVKNFAGRNLSIKRCESDQWFFELSVTFRTAINGSGQTG